MASQTRTCRPLTHNSNLILARDGVRFGTCYALLHPRSSPQGPPSYRKLQEIMARALSLCPASGTAPVGDVLAHADQHSAHYPPPPVCGPFSIFRPKRSGWKGQGARRSGWPVARPGKDFPERQKRSSGDIRTCHAGPTKRITSPKH